MYFSPVGQDTITNFIDHWTCVAVAASCLTFTATNGPKARQGKANSSDTVTSAILHNFDSLDTNLLSGPLLSDLEEPGAAQHVVWDVSSDVSG
jgi:hypothetical protein